jgi:hypothetical protein
MDRKDFHFNPPQKGKVMTNTNNEAKTLTDAELQAIATGAAYIRTVNGYRHFHLKGKCEFCLAVSSKLDPTKE